MSFHQLSLYSRTSKDTTSTSSGRDPKDRGKNDGKLNALAIYASEIGGSHPSVACAGLVTTARLMRSVLCAAVRALIPVRKRAWRAEIAAILFVWEVGTGLGLVDHKLRIREI